MKSNKILNILIAAIALIGGFLFIRVFMEGSEAIKTDVDVANSVVSPLISFSFWMFIIGVIITVVLSIWTIIKNPENLKKTLGGLAVLAVFLFIAYFLADSNAVYDANNINILKGGEEGSTTNKWVGTGIWYSFILGTIAALFFVFDLLKGLVKS